MPMMEELTMDAYVWKFARNAEGTQEQIKLMDATKEQLQMFYDHCQTMLYNKDSVNPGRYELLKLINEQRKKCNVELFLRKLESGVICADSQPYPRHLYIQDLRAFMNIHKTEFPSSNLKNISIAACTGNLPREFERISIEEVLDGGLDQLGYFDNKHITFSFILKLGVHLTPEEMKDFDEKDAEGNTRSKLEVIKERLNIKNTVRLTVKPSGLNFSELRAMINLRPKKYSELTTDQLITLRNKVLFKLENEVQYHAEQWENRLNQILKVCEFRGIQLVFTNNIESTNN
jgi:hypothetical protein